jgi:Fe-S cluster biogenesis protein NfuA
VNGEGGHFRDRLGRVDALVRALEELPDTAAREAARALTRALLDLHATGLSRMLELAGPDAVARFADDAQVGGLLLLHGLHPLPPADRVSRLLEQVRPHFHSVGGDVELVTATDEVVRLRLRGNPAADRTLRGMAGELVIEAVPDVAAVEFEEAWDRPESGRTPLPLLNGVPKG